MRIIPAIDIYNGQVVKMRQGDTSTTTTYSNSLEGVLEQYQAPGTDLLHIVDVNAARNEGNNRKLILKAIKNTGTHIQLGGGIRTLHDVQKLLAEGVYRVVLGTAALQDPEFLSRVKEKANVDHVVLAVDQRNGILQWKGWTQDAPFSLLEYIDRCAGMGFIRFLCTDVSRDGILKGTSVRTYKKILNQYPFIKLIASGGFSSMTDMRKFSKTGVEAVQIGRALYDGKIKLEQIQKWNLKALADL